MDLEGEEARILDSMSPESKYCSIGESHASASTPATSIQSSQRASYDSPNQGDPFAPSTTLRCAFKEIMAGARLKGKKRKRFEEKNEERRRLIKYVLHSLDVDEKARLDRHLDEYLRMARGSKAENECWISERTSAGSSETVRFSFRSFLGNLTLALGTWVMIARGTLTDKQKSGLLGGPTDNSGRSFSGRLVRWDLSHLCGNWKCVNPKHHVYEIHSMNCGRRSCHRTRRNCIHSPPCILGVQLPADKLRAKQKYVDVKQTQLST